MPELRDESYNENKGEWFPFHSNENPNTRSRAMYFFHNSLGEVTPEAQIGFTDQITIGGSDAGGGGGSNNEWQGKASDIVSWPITDATDQTLEFYSDGSRCYQYRFRNGNLRWHINHPPGWDFSLDPGNVENQAGVSGSDAEIYKRYVDALEFILDGNKTKSIRLEIQDDESEDLFRECLVDIALTYTDPDGIERICDGSYDQTTGGVNGSGNVNNTAGYFCSPSPVVDGFGTNENWLQKLGGAMDAANGGNGINADRVWTWNGAAQWQTSSSNSNGQIFFNRKNLNDDLPTTETREGFFMIDDSDLDYESGDYLLLEAADEENEFHNRVVFVNSVPTTSDGTLAYEIQLLDDIGFFNEDPEEFTITKLTNAPKLKIRYRIPDLGDETITIVDDQGDVN
ncbi:MAG: hypothetical protein CMP84_15700 [Gammaproteobacteria bacterium]|nr:hypothetical protein [Gammaproteobacteria bacterium]|tara:strand:+ start:217 stop:1413 length:1197 start_codon:yes stop_codon:yes gene_type:complete